MDLVAPALTPGHPFLQLSHSGAWSGFELADWVNSHRAFQGSPDQGLILIQTRRPGRYRPSNRLATTPSNPSRQTASK